MLNFPNDKSVYVLDGGFSSQISRHVGTNIDGDPLWSARFLQTNPDEVLQTHLDFLRAGADIISTNTYQASIEGFVKHLGVTIEQSYGVIKRAVDLAKSARKTYVEECRDIGLPFRNIYIAGSVGPYGAYLHDGSEYTGLYANSTPEKVLYDWHKPRIDTLISSGVDLLALETIPCEQEALVLINILKEYPETKAWISFSCKDDSNLAHGEKFQSVARKCWELNQEQLVAVGMNCLSPSYVKNLIKDISDGLSTPLPIVTYPNSGEMYINKEGWVGKEKCQPLHSYINDWLTVDLNVKFIGGCCRIYAEDISSIRKKVDSLS